MPTPTKPGREGTGLNYVVDATARAPWSVWITGGVVPDAVPALVTAGARHFVAVRWLTEADDPRAPTRTRSGARSTKRSSRQAARRTVRTMASSS